MSTVTLARIRGELQTVLAEMDPATWDGPTAKSYLLAFRKVERLAANGKTLAMRRVGETNATARDPEPDPASWFAGQTGDSPGTAKRTAELAAKIPDRSPTELALRAGTISPEHAEKIAAAIEKNPGAETELIRSAQHDDWSKFRDRARRARTANESAAERGARQRTAVYVRRDQDDEGLRRITIGMTPEQALGFEPIWDRFAALEFDRARREGRRESSATYAIEALITMANLAFEYLNHCWNASDRLAQQFATHAQSADPAQTTTDSTARRAETLWAESVDGPPPATGTDESCRKRDDFVAGMRARKNPISVHALLLVDAEAVRRGATLPGERCEIAGIGPINLDYARELLGDAVVDILVHDGVDVRTVAHAGRSANRRQKAALLAEWQCEIRGCYRIRGLEIDHIDPHCDTHETRIEKLGPKCKHHHDLKTYRGWTDGPRGPDGKRDLIPPDTPTAGPAP